MVSECPESRSGSRANGTGAAKPLGRGDVFALTPVNRVEVEEIGCLGGHRGNSFRSMNLAGSKLIERYPGLSSKYCEKALSCW